MKVYLDLLKHVLENGEQRADRTGTGTLSVFGHQNRYDLSEGFPLVTTKKCHLRSIIHELLWFLSGDTNIKYLKDNKVSIWDEWADANGNLGPVYGYQWRNWGGTGLDQIADVVERIKKDPSSRRLIVNAWNVTDVNKMALPPCHTMFQFYVHGDRNSGSTALGIASTASDKRLSCQLYQRSADLFLGVPFNIASYALLTMMVAQVCDLKPGYFVHTFGDLHLYLNHLEQARLQLTREPQKLPIMKLNPAVRSIFEFKYEDFTLEGYAPHPAIAAPISV